MLETYQCCKCRHEWLDEPGAFGACFVTGCPACGSLYWRWISYGKK